MPTEAKEPAWPLAPIKSETQPENSTADLDKKVKVSGKAWSGAGLYKLSNAEFKLWHYYRGWPNGCWKSDPNVAEELNMGVATVRRARKSLAKSGLIKADSKHETGTWIVEAVIKMIRGGVIKMIKGVDQNDHSSVIKMISNNDSKRVSIVSSAGQDDRFALFKAKVTEFQMFLADRLGLVEQVVWDEGDDKQLSAFLKKWPKLTIKEFHQALSYYSRSDNVNLARTPKEFLPRLHLYFNGELDQYGNLRKEED